MAELHRSRRGPARRRPRDCDRPPPRTPSPSRRRGCARFGRRSRGDPAWRCDRASWCPGGSMSPAAGCSYRLAGSSGSSDDSLDRPRRRSTRETVAVDTPVSSAMRAPVMRSRRNCSMRLTTLGGVAARRCIGREERSLQPGRPLGLETLHPLARRALGDLERRRGGVQGQAAFLDCLCQGQSALGRELRVAVQLHLTLLAPRRPSP
jgi:hypothetical protein